MLRSEPCDERSMPCVALAKQGSELRMASQPLDVPMHYVYLLRSESEPLQRYIGLTDDVQARLASHNSGANPHTAKFRPWRLVAFLALESREKAAAFERYLKHGSGHSFANRHLW